MHIFVNDHRHMEPRRAFTFGGANHQAQRSLLVEVDRRFILPEHQGISLDYSLGPRPCIQQPVLSETRLLQQSLVKDAIFDCCGPDDRLPWAARNPDHQLRLRR